MHSPVVDLHCDLTLELAHAGDDRDPFAEYWRPAMAAGRVITVGCSVWTPPSLAGAEALKSALAQILELRRAIDRDRTVALARTREALAEAVRDDRRLAVVLALEGCEALAGDSSLIELFADLGVRIASLTWSGRNAFGSGDSQTGGLTRAGRELLRRMEDCGVALDLAHANEQTFDEAMDAFGGPVLVSHTACRALLGIARNLTDEQLRRVAGREGVVGIMIHPAAIGSPVLSGVVDHVAHAVDVVGMDHVAIGADFSQRLVRSGAFGPIRPSAADAAATSPGVAIDSVTGPEQLPTLVAALEGRLGREIASNVVSASALTWLRRALPVAT